MGSQLVGFSVNPERSMLTRMSRTWVTIPSMIVGIGSLPVGSIADLRGVRVDLQPEADHDRTEIERTDNR